MTKFEITETQIDNYNDTSNQTRTFEGGLNIICGKNEAGKSTMMDFIKNILIKKSDAKGYIKCRYDDKEFVLRAEKNKRKDNNVYIENLASNGLLTGFLINIDDIMFAKKAKADELLEMIKDSSGTAVNKKEDEYREYIYDSKRDGFTLTSTNNLSANFRKQFDKLSSLNDNIKTIQLQEEEYNNLCAEIEVVKKMISDLKEKNIYSDLLSQKQQYSEKLENIKINKKLLDKKSDFDELSISSGALNFAKENEEKLSRILDEKREKIKEKTLVISRIEDFDDSKINQYNYTSEDLKSAQNLIKKYNELSAQKESETKEINSKISFVESLKQKFQTLNERLSELGIKDIDTYKTDKLLLENYKTNYSDILEKLHKEVPVNKNAGWYNRVFFMLFAGMLFFCAGALISHWHSSMRTECFVMILVSIVGINTTIMNYLSNKKEVSANYDEALKKDVSEIIRICKNYNFHVEKTDDIVPKLSTFLQRMNEKKEKYEDLEKDINNLKEDIKKEENELSASLDKKKNLEMEIDKINAEKAELTGRLKITDLENFPQFYTGVNEYKQILDLIIKTESELKETDKKIEDFIQKLNNFVEETEVIGIQKLSKYDYPEINDVLQKLRKASDEAVLNNNLVSELKSEIEKTEKKLEEYPEEIRNNITDFDKTLLQSKIEEGARLEQRKENLEAVNNLVGLKNEKMAELSRIKNSVKYLIQKEMVYNIIKKSKEKFNETQPNLMSAKEYLSEITGGKYDDIDFETKIITGKNLPDKDWDELSRGTKEQLYLALRLGYAENYSKTIDNQPNGLPDLPLIIDEAFVNFDAQRTISSFRCLDKLSEKNQVLYFTCHPDTITKLLDDEKIKYNLIKL